MKTIRIPMMVDTEEGLALQAYKVTLKWGSEEDAKANSNLENKPWDEFYFTNYDANTFEMTVKSQFEPEMIVVKVEEISVVNWE